MILRQFQKEDARACVNMITDCINADTSLDAKSRFYLLSNAIPADFYHDIKNDYALVGELHGQVVAVGVLGNNKIYNINVSPDYRGNGFGDTLMVSLEAEAHARGIEIIQVEAPLNTVEFYKNLGYDMLKHVHAKIGKTTVEVARMQKSLSKLAGV